MKLYDGSIAESSSPTAYAVDCENCGLVYMTPKCYDTQMSHPDSFWKCPRCGQSAQWNDDVFEASLEAGQ